MDQRHLRQFIAVAEEHCFSLAAKRLGISQPALSRQVRHLEEKLGVPLFIRTKRRVELTEAGQVFLDEVRRGLLHIDWAMQAARQAGHGEVGRLAIGFVGPATYSVLPPAMQAFQRRFPRVELDLDEASTGEQMAALREGRLQLGFLCPSAAYDDLSIEPVLAEAVVVAVPRGHPLAAEPRVHLSALAAEPLLMVRRELEPTLFESYMELCADAGVTPNLLLGPNPLHLRLSLVAAGLGFAIVPASVRNLRRPDLVYRALHPQPPKLILAAAWRPDDPSPTLRAFLGVMREVIQRQRPVEPSTPRITLAGSARAGAPGIGR